MTARVSLDALAADPVIFETLPAVEQDGLYARIAALEANCRSRLLTRPVTPAVPDRAVALDEACILLGMTRPYLERKTNWVRLGGYKDHDGHVKFPLSTLQRHIKMRRS